jgi:IS605 OrfB family transposase
MKKGSNSKSTKRQVALGVMTRVLRLRIKDKHAKHLLEQSREVNQVWNYCNETSHRILERERRFCTGYDLDKLTSGASKEGMSLHSQTVQAISAEYCTRRKQFKKAKLRWRVSHGSRRSLGWIPVKASALNYRAGQVHYQGKALSLWDSFGLADYQLRSGSFSEDSRGRWYLNVTVDVKQPAKTAGTSSVGIDLGLKDLAALSNGETVEAQQFYRDLEPALAVSQRAGNKDRTKAIHAKISNRRKDFLHKLSTRLVKEHGAIFIGNVNAAGLAKTNMAKSVLDAGWSMFRTQLQYKGDSAGSWVREVNEAYSTQECSCCHARTGPKGLAGLGARQWTCSVCQSEHDRDTNAAKNILARGLVELEREFTTAGEAKAVEAAVNKDGQPSQVGHDLPVAGIIAPLGR